MIEELSVDEIYDSEMAYFHKINELVRAVNHLLEKETTE